MCRKSVLRGYCIVMFGLGLIAGHCLENWLVCCGGGLVLIVLGFCTAQKR